jgi:glycosyltransferase involved in cell wall biosynthesis
MRILHVITSPRAEGTVRLVLDWLQDLPGTEQHVLALSPNPAELTAELKQSAASYTETAGLPAGPVKFPWLVWTARREARRVRPDVVICWPTGFAGFVLLGCRFAGVRGLIAHSGNPPTPTAKGFLHGLVTASLIWLVRGKVICCSEYVARRFREEAWFPKSILRAVWNCAQVERFRERVVRARVARTSPQPVVVMVATLEAHKDHATLLRAWARVQQHRPDAQLWLAGEGSLRASLESLASNLGITGSVRFLGSRKDIPEVLAQADLFVFSTTVREGLGTVLVEALAADLPILASDVPACRELLQDGRWGTLVSPADEVALADGILARLSGPPPSDLRERSVFLQRFSVATMAESYLAARSP